MKLYWILNLALVAAGLAPGLAHGMLVPSDTRPEPSEAVHSALYQRAQSDVDAVAERRTAMISRDRTILELKAMQRREIALARPAERVIKFPAEQLALGLSVTAGVPLLMWGILSVFTRRAMRQRERERLACLPLAASTPQGVPRPKVPLSKFIENRRGTTLLTPEKTLTSDVADTPSHSHISPSPFLLDQIAEPSHVSFAQLLEALPVLSTIETVSMPQSVGSTQPVCFTLLNELKAITDARISKVLPKDSEPRARPVESVFAPQVSAFKLRESPAVRSSPNPK